MPTYTFRNTETGEVYDAFMKISERDLYLTEHPEIEPVPTSALLHSGTGLGKKPAAGFRDRLKQIKDYHSRGVTKSTINTW